MAHRLYAVKEDERCPGCGYRRTDERHFRMHVAPNRWPESMRGHAKAKRVVVNGKVYDADKAPRFQVVGADDEGLPVIEPLPEAEQYRVTESGTLVPHYECECGYTGTSASGLRLHRSRAKQHREAVLSG